ncbi:DUF1385 domain-containing protein [Selenomonas sp. TAMA-11512]|uniref:DUF1385 domain-containing protein n=1 Tax=Selenomonas sp. TAMA-11512 TaxID=3095337 RepID=UPI00308A9791|nr:DUF1385 domain-containing protein [Selenomonas sp. TAMA-11512]
MKENSISIGGQAVIEGVMMRGPVKVATAVRTPSGEIEVETKDIVSFLDRYPLFKKPFLRGTIALVESLVYGIKSLSYSAQMAGEDDEKITDRELVGTILLAFLLAAVLFIAIPTGAAKLFDILTDDPVFLNLMEGVLRLVIFLLYIWGIGRAKDIQRVFQYHGAEHKTIHCFEAGEVLTVENVQRHPRLHPRCGTSFLLIVMLVSIFVFAFLGWPSLIERIASRVLLLPVVAGISYEFIRLAGRSENFFVKAFSWPGLQLQCITTSPPDDDMVEVAIESVKAALPRELILAGTPDYIAKSRLSKETVSDAENADSPALQQEAHHAG